MFLITIDQVLDIQVINLTRRRYVQDQKNQFCLKKAKCQPVYCPHNVSVLSQNTNKEHQKHTSFQITMHEPSIQVELDRESFSLTQLMINHLMEGLPIHTVANSRFQILCIIIKYYILKMVNSNFTGFGNKTPYLFKSIYIK